MFARARLEPGSPEFEAYYEMRPENRKPDELTRRMPGLLSPETRYEDARLFASAKASFGLTEALRDAVDGRVTGMADDGAMSPDAETDYVKALASYYGAKDVGITDLRPYHVYSHVGRGSGEYGAPIEVEHQFAIAFTVEMAFDMVGAAPHAPTVIESARQYVESARVAVQLAGAIRALGWPARAHIDGNYRVIVPLVARDAGLGEIGRMGLLMTPREGPRVRLGVVTTDLELVAHAYEPDAAVIDFCAICRKCAECCPSRSIPLGDREEIDGALRWRIDPDTCYRYWNVIGTDCARCMAVCPFSHPDTLAHNLIRWGIGRSAAVRRVALKMDDAFYGRKPESREPPAWTDFGERG
jgi:ferredoxin